MKITKVQNPRRNKCSELPSGRVTRTVPHRSVCVHYYYCHSNWWKCGGKEEVVEQSSIHNGNKRRKGIKHTLGAPAWWIFRVSYNILKNICLLYCVCINILTHSVKYMYSNYYSKCEMTN